MSRMEKNVPFVVMTVRSFPHSRLITECVARGTRWVPHIEQALLTLPEHLGTHIYISVVRIARSLVFCVMLCISLLVLLSLFILSIVLFVFRFTASDYPFGIFKFFFIYFNEYSLFFEIIKHIQSTFMMIFSPVILRFMKWFGFIRSCHLYNLRYL
jgi:hypothetical protein